MVKAVEPGRRLAINGEEKSVRIQISNTSSVFVDKQSMPVGFEKFD